MISSQEAIYKSKTLLTLCSTPPCSKKYLLIEKISTKGMAKESQRGGLALACRESQGMLTTLQPRWDIFNVSKLRNKLAFFMLIGWSLRAGHCQNVWFQPLQSESLSQAEHGKTQGGPTGSAAGKKLTKSIVIFKIQFWYFFYRFMMLSLHLLWSKWSMSPWMSSSRWRRRDWQSKSIPEIYALCCHTL